jgi:hypothetical protein
MESSALEKLLEEYDYYFSDFIQRHTDLED